VSKACSLSDDPVEVAAKEGPKPAQEVGFILGR
jgi:hypothetical protein